MPADTESIELKIIKERVGRLELHEKQELLDYLAKLLASEDSNAPETAEPVPDDEES